MLDPAALVLTARTTGLVNSLVLLTWHLLMRLRVCVSRSRTFYHLEHFSDFIAVFIPAGLARSSPLESYSAAVNTAGVNAVCCLSQRFLLLTSSKCLTVHHSAAYDGRR